MCAEREGWGSVYSVQKVACNVKVVGVGENGVDDDREDAGDGGSRGDRSIPKLGNRRGFIVN